MTLCNVLMTAADDSTGALPSFSPPTPRSSCEPGTCRSHNRPDFLPMLLSAYRIAENGLTMATFIGSVVVAASLAIGMTLASAQSRYMQDQIDPAQKNPIRIRDMA